MDISIVFLWDVISEMTLSMDQNTIEWYNFYLPMLDMIILHPPLQ